MPIKKEPEGFGVRYTITQPITVKELVQYDKNVPGSEWWEYFSAVSRLDPDTYDAYKAALQQNNHSVG